MEQMNQLMNCTNLCIQLEHLTLKSWNINVNNFEKHEHKCQYISNIKILDIFMVKIFRYFMSCFSFCHKALHTRIDIHPFTYTDPHKDRYITYSDHTVTI